MRNGLGFEQIVESERAVWEVQTAGAGPQGRLPITAEMLLEQPSGDIFGLTQNAGMGWDPRELGRAQYLLQIVVDRNTLEGSIDLVGHGDTRFGPEEGARVLASRPPRPDLAPDPGLPADTRLWAALQQVGGGTWAGCVYDVDAIVAALGGAVR